MALRTYDDPMSSRYRTLRLTDLPEAASSFDGKYPNNPVDQRPAKEQEEAVLAHQRRIDAARNDGLLLDAEDREELRYSYLWRPGYESSPRGIQLGAGLGYRTGAPVSP